MSKNNEQINELLQKLVQKVSTEEVPEENKSEVSEVCKVIDVHGEIGFLSDNRNFIGEVPEIIKALINLYKENSDTEEFNELTVLILKTFLED